MAVMNDKQRDEAFRLWNQGVSKMEIARRLNTSARSVGREIEKRLIQNINFLADEIEENRQESDDDDPYHIEYDEWEDIYEDDVDEWEDDEWFEDDDDESEDELEEFDFVMTKNSITIFNDEKSHTFKDNRKDFSEIKAYLLENDFNQDSLRTVVDVHTFESNLDRVFHDGSLRIEPNKNTVVYTDPESGFEIPIPSDLRQRLVEIVASGEVEKCMNLVNFTRRLMNNPSSEAIEGLYRFLQANCIDIAEDGKVIAFKKIRADFTDVHTGTIDNSIGAEPNMPRSMVNPNPNETCSRGLHVCSSSYLPHFPGDIIVKVEVDPADFVAVPGDYQDAKARVCRYKVLEVVSSITYHF